MKQLLTITLLLSIFSALSQEIPQPDWDELEKTKPWAQTELYKEVPKVTPGVQGGAPSDAVVLFDGTDLSKWQKAQFNSPVAMDGFKVMIPQLDPNFTSGQAEWKLEAGEMVVAPGKGGISTKQAFGDIQLHLEWLAPAAEDKEGQQYSNSGVFFMSVYEVQVLNSYENPTYSNGQASSVYKQHIPLVNASKPVDNWQTYDIIFMAPKFSDRGTLLSPAKVTVLHNGVLVQNGVELLGPTCYIGTPYYVPHASKLPLMLQDHGDPMRFRNIWVREL